MIIFSFKKEIKILKDCKSPYILEYYGSYYKDNQIWLIIEYCDAGSVLDLMKISKSTLNEFEIASIVEKVLRALIFLHDGKKIHRDLKSGNILLNHKGEVKLGDFGVSAQLMNSCSKKNSKIGTPYWMSPEIIQQSMHNQSTDIWSLGITCIEMAEGEPPFSNIKPFRAMINIIKNPPRGLSKAEEWSREFNEFVGICLTLDPRMRPNSKDLLNHRFIKEKSRGSALISELVGNNINEINQYRLTHFLTDSEDKGTIISKRSVNSGNDLILDDNENHGTMFVREETLDCDKNSFKMYDQKQKDEPLFMKFYNEKDISYDEEKMENDLIKNMEVIKQGIIIDKNGSDKIDVNDNVTLTSNVNNEHSSQQILHSSSNNFNKSEFCKYNNNKVNGNQLKTKQIKNNQNETSIISKNSLNIFSKNNSEFMLGLGINKFNNKLAVDIQVNVSTPRNTLQNEIQIKPQDLLGDKSSLRLKKSKAKSSDVNLDIFIENDIKTYNLEKIELLQKSIFLEMEREIELIRLKFTPKIMKLNYAAEFLKKNPHLKNLKEVEEYEKFSRSIEKSVVSTKNFYDLSVGVNSGIPTHNPIKVNNYKPNNISHLNSKIIEKKGFVKTKQKNFSAS